MPVTISGTDGISIDGDPVATDTDLSALVTGKVLQVVWANTGTQQTSTSTSFVDITGLSLSITPTSASSKILVSVALQMSSTGPGPVARILRDATDITAGGSGSYLGFAMNEDTPANSLVYQALDEPSSTSSLTYKVQARRHAGSGTFYVNDRSGGGFGLLSSITAMEIAS